MSRRALRQLSNWILGRLVGLAPAHMQNWAEAVRAEAAAIADDGEALRFAAGAGSGLALTFIKTRLSDALGLASDRLGPRRLAALAATAAVMIGVIHLHVADASSSMILVNLASLGVGLALLAGAAVWQGASDRGRAIAALSMAGLLVLTSLFGVASHGVVRWVAAGPLLVQSSLILLPALLTMFARKTTAAGAAALVVAAVAMAMQPDRAMAGAMVAGIAMLWLLHRNRQVAIVLAASASGFVATLVRADNLPPVRFTEGVFTQTWQVHPLLGFAVASAGALLLLPAAAFGPRDSDCARQCAVFGAIWLAIILAAVIGNYPTPLVGYGGSAIIGYLLSACMLPPTPLARQGLHSAVKQSARSQPDNLARLFPRRTSCA
ncbi:MULTISPECIES: hypothetical protein [unclassified Sphingomonas]|jgi:hypothetical protein|uniref:hypothetical protein n=1 Tax=unclassified Sphingomonas TaxID=196159 RepID=UPI000AD7B908|nr:MULTISPECIES: hypothetical protein [unclassified Sphingomonas]